MQNKNSKINLCKKTISEGKNLESLNFYLIPIFGKMSLLALFSMAL